MKESFELPPMPDQEAWTVQEPLEYEEPPCPDVAQTDALARDEELAAENAAVFKLPGHPSKQRTEIGDFNNEPGLAEGDTINDNDGDDDGNAGDGAGKPPKPPVGGESSSDDNDEGDEPEKINIQPPDEDLLDNLFEESTHYKGSSKSGVIRELMDDYEEPYFQIIERSDLQRSRPVPELEEEDKASATEKLRVVSSSLSPEEIIARLRGLDMDRIQGAATELEGKVEQMRQDEEQQEHPLTRLLRTQREGQQQETPEEQDEED